MLGVRRGKYKWLLADGEQILIVFGYKPESRMADQVPDAQSV
jgi:hypothetical protein